VRRIVVAGAGLAGLRAAETVRRSGFDGALTVLGAEPHPPYHRPPLSKQVLSGAEPPESTRIPREDLAADWRFGTAATGLDLAGRHVLTSAGEQLPFDGLVLATGSRARSWPGLPDLAGFHTLRTLDDAAALARAAASAQRAVIVGAGFVGCEVAASLRGLGLEVAVVDLAPHPLMPFGPVLGARARALHEAHGVTFHLGTTVAAFEGSTHVTQVVLADGTRLPADFVVLALGAVPDTQWLAGSGLLLDAAGAVLCDRYLGALGSEGIVVAGDIAAWQHVALADAPLRVEHWTTAAEMGMAAAENLIADPAGRRPFDAVPTVWSDQFGHRFQYAGFPALATDWTTVDDDAGTGRLVIVGSRTGQPVAALAIDAARRIVRYRGSIAASLRAAAV
jgi:3-phenylpropionate/trans-cinnamate dioxygenase ferredoxin reductase subunit